MKQEGKVKAFIKEHKTGLTIAGGVCLGALGGIVGYKTCYGRLSGKYVFLDGDSNIGKVIAQMKADFPDKHARFIRANLEEGFKVAELGKLGENMVEAGAPVDAVLTHFICVGPVPAE